MERASGRAVASEVLWRDGEICQRCLETRDLDLHHIVSRADGGGDDPDNLTPLCSRCHGTWHDYYIGDTDFARWVSQVPAHVFMEALTDDAVLSPLVPLGEARAMVQQVWDGKRCAALRAARAAHRTQHDREQTFVREREALLEALSSGPFTVSGVAAALAQPYSRVSYAVREQLARGMLVREGRQGGAIVYRPRVPAGHDGS